MSWIPDPPVILVLLKRIEQGENLLQDSCELFWCFYLQSMGPEEFKERTDFWINRQLEDGPKGGGFMDPEIRDYILSGPEKLSQVIIDKLDDLAERLFVPYTPDVKEDQISLYTYLNIEATRFTRFLNEEQYSERTRDNLTKSLTLFHRCSHKNDFTNSLWSKEYDVSLYALGSLLHVTEFRMEKSDGQYETAMESIAKAFAMNIIASTTFPKYGFDNPAALPLISLINSIGDVWNKSPWMRDLDPQEIVNCFEAIAQGNNKIKKEVADICSLMAMVANSWWPIASKTWPDEEQEIEVRDSKEETWNLPEFWQHAAGWAEAQLTPSELKDLLNEREDQSAENRLRTYFFGAALWDKLPERTRRSVVSADRDWFDGKLTRTESILNELQIATIELLINGLWNPMEEWLKGNRTEHIDTFKFDELKSDLKAKNRSLTALDLERICRMPVTVAFLNSKGLLEADVKWITNAVPRNIFKLRQARNEAEHESGDTWDRERLGYFFEEFVGIGQSGILPRLGRLLW